MHLKNRLQIDVMIWGWNGIFYELLNTSDSDRLQILIKIVEDSSLDLKSNLNEQSHTVSVVD